MKSIVILGVVAWALQAVAQHTPGPLPPDHFLYGEDFQPLLTSEDELETREPQGSGGSSVSCTNGPTTRSCWSDGFNVATDFDKKWPNTGVTRSYTLTATNTTCNPDGYGSRICFMFNGQLPGPLIEANWGDTIKITVVNQLQNNGTGLHFHGTRQYLSNTMDGVDGVTQCPIPPGHSLTYTYRATQFGSSWYHSHFSSQYGDGLWGPTIIHGPTSANWDIDVGPVAVSDWYYKTSDEILALTTQALQNGGPGPSGDNILFNGKAKNRHNGGGSYANFKFTAGKKHLLRFVNSGVQDGFRVSIDKHKLLLVTSDLVPVMPLETDSVLIGPGQRYTVVVKGDQPVGNYWMRATLECFTGNGAGYGLAVVSYKGAKGGDPTTQSTAVTRGCNEPSPLTPWVRNTVASVDQFKQQAKSLPVDIIRTASVTTNQKNVVAWGLNMTAINIKWEKPTLQYVETGNTNYPTQYNLLDIPKADMWVFWVIQEVQGGVANIPHPMHLHGHDFYFLGSGTGQFNMKTDPDKLTYTNPTRRDTAYLPANGWMVMAFPMDNPGAWIMHCHIAWHVSEGLGLQFLERKGEIPGKLDQANCANWRSYMKNGMIYPKQDSGLKARADTLLGE